MRTLNSVPDHASLKNDLMVTIDFIPLFALLIKSPLAFSNNSTSSAPLQRGEGRASFARPSRTTRWKPLLLLTRRYSGLSERRASQNSGEADLEVCIPGSHAFFRKLKSIDHFAFVLDVGFEYYDWASHSYGH